MDDQSVSVEGAGAVPECNVGRGQTNYKTGSMSSKRDAQLDELLIGGQEQRPIMIVDYDEGWPARFDELAPQINHARGTTVLSVDYIWSTAVPRLPAKPIIDILLIVMNVEEERAYVLPLESARFVLRVREPGHRMFRTTEKDVHIHVFEPNSEQIADYRDLRDWLRISQIDRDLYSSTKKQLAQQVWRDMNYYSDAKTTVVQQSLGHARDWHATNHT